MAGRKSGGADNIIEIASRFPWWVGVVLAAVSFVLLHAVASMDVPTITDHRQAGGLVVRQLVKMLAFYGQWVLPLLLLAGAGFSALNQRKRRALHERITSDGGRALQQISWQQFESLVGEYFRQRGFRVAESGGGGTDGGVDLVLTLGSDRYLVQCKHWRALKVGVEPVRELYGVMTARRAAGGFVVTSGAFTEEAKKFAEGREVELIDGGQLQTLIQRQASPVRPGPRTEPAALPAASDSPRCPKCSAPMIKRVARQGELGGKAFWGCSRSPSCRGIRPTEA
jgi:restriction system protein